MDFRFFAVPEATWLPVPPRRVLGAAIGRCLECESTITESSLQRVPEVTRQWRRRAHEINGESSYSAAR